MNKKEIVALIREYIRSKEEEVYIVYPDEDKAQEWRVELLMKDLEVMHKILRYMENRSND